MEESRRRRTVKSFPLKSTLCFHLTASAAYHGPTGPLGLRALKSVPDKSTGSLQGPHAHGSLCLISLKHPNPCFLFVCVGISHHRNLSLLPSYFSYFFFLLSLVVSRACK